MGRRDGRDDRPFRSMTDTEPEEDHDWRRVAARCCRHRHLLNDWENTFLNGLGRFPRLSQKQQRSLDLIITKLRASGRQI